MGQRSTGWITFLTAGVLALFVSGLTPVAGSAAASPALRLASSSAASPNQLALNRQVDRARSRFAANVGMSHAGIPEAITHPTQDSTGSGIAARIAAQPAKIQASSRLATRVLGQATAVSNQLGLDVASYQGIVDWTQVSAGGATFAYTKATEGIYYYDNGYFPEQYNGAYSAGLVRGAYHFAVPDNSTGAAQADYFVANGGGWTADGRTLPGMLDIEYNPYGPECYGLTPSQMVAWITSFDNEYHTLTTRWPDIYTSTRWWSMCTGNSGAFQHESLTIANWSDSPYPLPASWGTQTIWQYADSGTFPGDQDMFNGSQQALVAFAAGLNADRMLSAQELQPGQAISSANGFEVVMQGDGNLVEYAPGGRALWSSGTSRNPGAYVVMQSDGNLVVYLGTRVLWQTKTNGRGPSHAVIQGDANFVVYTNTGKATWSSQGGRIG